MNREELIEEAAKAIARSRGDFLDGEQDRISARAAFAVFEKAQAPTDDEREALSNFLFSVYEHGSQPNALREADAILSFLASIRPAQTEPTDAQIAAMTDPNSITDEQADAAQLAHYRFVFGEEGVPNQRELGIGRQAMKVAISEAVRAAFTAGQEDKP